MNFKFLYYKYIYMGNYKKKYLKYKLKFEKLIQIAGTQLSDYEKEVINDIIFYIEQSNVKHLEEYLEENENSLSISILIEVMRQFIDKLSEGYIITDESALLTIINDKYLKLINRNINGILVYFKHNLIKNTFNKNYYYRYTIAQLFKLFKLHFVNYIILFDNDYMKKNHSYFKESLILFINKFTLIPISNIIKSNYDNVPEEWYLVLYNELKKYIIDIIANFLIKEELNLIEYIPTELYDYFISNKYQIKDMIEEHEYNPDAYSDFEPDVDDILGLYGNYGFHQLMKDLNKSENELKQLFKKKKILKSCDSSWNEQKLYEHIKIELMKFI